jgi:hypothetical protein
MTISLVAVSPASAESLQGQLAHCVRITGLLQRLACYDGAVKDAGIVASALPHESSSSEHAPPIPAPVMGAPALTSAAPASSPLPSGSSFGSESLPRARMPPSGSGRAIAAGVTSLAFDGMGRFTVTLDNGQIWRQLPGDTVLLHQTQVGMVRITRSVFGNYDLSVPGLHANYRVERLQ